MGTKELIWTLTANGKTERAYASLKTDYQIDPQVISTEVGGDFGSLRDELRTNMPPDAQVFGARRRTVKVGEPVTLTVAAADPDNIPARADREAARGRARRRPSPPPRCIARRARSCRRAGRGCGSRGSSIAATRRGQLDARPDEDVDRHARVRELAVVAAVVHSRGAEGRQVDSQATFTEPGEYVLRAVASDGALFTYRT